MAEYSDQSQTFCGGCSVLFRIQISPKTTAQTATAAAATRTTTLPKGFLRTGYWAHVTDCVRVVCARACVCVSENSRIWCHDCHKPLKRVARVFVNSVWCVSLIHTMTRTLFHTHLVSPGVQSSSTSGLENQAANKTGEMRLNEKTEKYPSSFKSSAITGSVNLWRPDDMWRTQNDQLH